MAQVMEDGILIGDAPVKSVMTKSSLPVGGYSVNPYVGCTHACKYCYASFMKRFTGHTEPWGTFLDVKHWPEIKNPKKYAGQRVVIGSVTDGYNPHDELIPEVSVKMITRHTEAGAKILEAKGFPKEIISAAIQHHGDSSVGYFYHKAQNITEGTLEEKGYTYLGPKPQTKINAIIMIADIAEAATRSVRPSTHEELATLIDNLVRSKMNERQFDEAPITMAELTKVKKAVVSTLMGVHHERISYTLDNKRK